MAEQTAGSNPKTNLHVLPRDRTASDVISDLMDNYDLDNIDIVVIVKPAAISGTSVWSNGLPSTTITWLLNHAIWATMRGDLV